MPETDNGTVVFVEARQGLGLCCPSATTTFYRPQRGAHATPKFDRVAQAAREDFAFAAAWIDAHWPFVYDDDELNPQDEPLEITQLQWAEKSDEPIGGYEAHAAAMQMRFYDGRLFPDDYRNDAFVAFHGSWNRKPASGYEVVRVRFDPAGTFEGFEPFVTGFLVPQPNQAAPLPGAQPLPPDDSSDGRSASHSRAMAPCWSAMTAIT